MTAFLYIPHNLLINEHTIKTYSPECHKVFVRHPEVFKTHFDAEYLTIILFIMHE
jgi:hypothetical protein